MRIEALLILTLLLSTMAASAQEEAAAPSVDEGEAQEFVTRHRIEIGGEGLAFRAVAGEIHLRDAAGKAEASIFSISYLLESVDDPSDRPLTFLFNGGPGSTAVWLHLGAFGPWRLDLPEDPTHPGAPPYGLPVNPHTLLPYSDLVFVDPVGTGYSRAMGEKKDADFWGVDEDGESMARFIRSYLSKYQRWNSPRFLAGESYGAIRVARLLRELHLEMLDNVAINGAIFIAPALDARVFLIGIPGNDLAYVTALPSYAATAFYHEALPAPPADLEAFLTAARQFAANEYLPALFAGSSLPDERRRQIAERLHYFTGLDVEYLLAANLEIPQWRFRKELLRDRGVTLATHDTRYTGRDPDEVGEAVVYDPFIPVIAAPFVSGINHLLQGALEVETDRKYEVFSFAANAAWKRPSNQQSAFSGFLNVGPILAEAAAANGDFRVFVASGHHDLTTTFFGTEFALDQSGLSKDRLTLENYHGGHMMYLHPPSLEKLTADVGRFIESR